MRKCSGGLGPEPKNGICNLEILDLGVLIVRAASILGGANSNSNLAHLLITAQDVSLGNQFGKESSGESLFCFIISMESIFDTPLRNFLYSSA